MGYKNQVIAGFSWHTGFKLVAMALALIKVSIVARLLTPGEMGTFALVAITLGITEAFTETGINVTIIQAKESISYYINTAWVISIIRGFLIGCLMIAAGVGLSRFFDIPDLLWLCGVAATIPVIKGFINPAIVSMHKEMQFAKDSTYRVILVVSEVFWSILLTWVTGSITGLILSGIITAVSEVIISFAWFSLRPQFLFTTNRARAILNNSKGLTLSATLTYLVENLDDFIIGKLLGSHYLGLYHQGYSLSHKATFDFSKALHHGSFPALAAIAHDRSRLRYAWLKSLSGIILLLCVTALPIILFPRFIVSIVLGSQWLEIASSLPMLVAAGVIQSLALTGYSVLLSTKRYTAINAHLATNLVLMLILLWWWGSMEGVYGAAWALLVSRLFALPFIIHGVYKTFREI